MQRRQILARTAALASMLTSLAPAALAQATAARAAAPAAKAAKVAGTLRIVIPANPGGGWDQTGRALGAALKAVGAADQVEYENIGGKGGTIGLAKYAEKYGSDANTLLMGGMVMVGAVALQKPAVDMGHIQPLARLTSDYLIAAVPAASSIKTGKDLANAMRTDLAALPVAGGSAGGVDHIYAGVLARAAKAKPEALVYRPFASGPEVVASLLKGDAAYLNNPKPSYHAISKRMGEQGKVVLRVLIGTDGVPQKVEVNKSSGFDRLDRQAQDAVMRWRFVPGKRNGVPEAMWNLVPVNFVLE